MHASVSPKVHLFFNTNNSIDKLYYLIYKYKNQNDFSVRVLYIN